MTNIAKVIEIVSAAPSSIFMKQDIINLLTDSVTEDPTPETDPENMTFTYTQVQEIMRVLLDQVESAIENIDQSSVVDERSVEFRLEGNCIEIDSLEIDTNQIFEEIKNSIDIDIAIDDVVSK